MGEHVGVAAQGCRLEGGGRCGQVACHLKLQHGLEPREGHSLCPHVRRRSERGSSPCWGVRCLAYARLPLHGRVLHPAPAPGAYRWQSDGQRGVGLRRCAAWSAAGLPGRRHAASPAWWTYSTVPTKRLPSTSIRMLRMAPPYSIGTIGLRKLRTEMRRKL